MERGMNPHSNGSSTGDYQSPRVTKSLFDENDESPSNNPLSRLSLDEQEEDERADQILAAHSAVMAAAAVGSSGGEEEEEEDESSPTTTTTEKEESSSASASASTNSVSTKSDAKTKQTKETTSSAQSSKNKFKRGTSRTPDAIQPVSLQSVRTQLQSLLVKQYSSEKQQQFVLRTRVAHGANDALLKQLLVLSGVRVAPDNKTNSSSSDHHKMDKIATFLASSAAEKATALLLKAEGAYDAMLKLLPKEKESSQDTTTMPDLLPPCSSSPDDATAQFFRACSAENVVLDASLDPGMASPETSPVKKQPASTGSSILSSVFHSVKGGGGGNSKNSSSPEHANSHSSQSASSSSQHHSSGLSRVFSKRRTGGKESKSSASIQSSASQDGTVATKHTEDGLASDEEDDAMVEKKLEYVVQIDREMLGLTVENVLERTVVRTVLPGGAAKKAGARVGSLIVKVGSVETKNLTHFETIDELRQSQRPLKLVLRRISKDALRGAREEMGRLIRGGGFGVGIATLGLDNTSEGDASGSNGDNGLAQGVPGVDETTNPSLQREEFAEFLRKRWAGQRTPLLNKKDEALSKVAEKLVWILTLLVIGLEREAAKLGNSQKTSGTSSTGSPHKYQQQHTAKEYADAAKSVSKILVDFIKVQLKVDPPPPPPPPPPKNGPNNPVPVPLNPPGPHGKRGRKINNPPPHQPLLGKQGAKAHLKRQHLQNMPGTGPQSTPQMPHVNSPLLQIGDVLHRTLTFLADPMSPPAALLRGEVIALLCDVLDIDTDMELSEEESTSSSADHNSTGPINDLGSAGSLLKLIVLNCSQSSSDGSMGLDSGSSEGDFFAGNRFLAVVHRLAASRSTSARVTACSLGPILWSHLDFPHQLQLRGVITRALHDIEVIVRKSTATVLHEIAELVFDPRAVPWLVLMCERAMTDPEPQLRSAAMTLTWHLAEHLPNAFLGDASEGSRSLRRLPSRSDPTFAEVYLLQCKLLPVATRLAEDRAPSVRLAVAAQCDRLCNALGQHWSSVIIDLLQALLGDADERVRSEAALCLPRLVESVILGAMSADARPSGVSVLESLLPVALKLLKDTSVPVRVSLATASGELLTLLVGLEVGDDTTLSGSPKRPSAGEIRNANAEMKKHKRHVDETLIPLVQELLHDKDPEVTSAALRAVTNASRGSAKEGHSRRHHGRHRVDTDDDTMSSASFHSHASIEKKEPVFVPVLSEDQVLRLLPTLSDLANSGQWRVRQSAVEIVPALLGCTHRLETRSEIAKLCVQLMGDSVDAVRKTAAECLCLGGGSLGRHGEDSKGEWIIHIVIPHLRECSQSPDSKQRLLSLKMVESILINGVCPPETKAVDSDEKPVSPLRELLEIAALLKDDRVVNVRLNVGRVFGSIVNMLEEDDLRFVIATLEKQMEDEKAIEGRRDRDVLYFARQAIGWSTLHLEDISMVSSHDESHG